MSKGLIDILLDNIFDSNWIGRRGEKLIERELNLVKLFGRKGKILRNLYVPKDNGETSEIDVVFITQKGIFVIESKNYSGWIFGDEKSPYWTVSLPNKMKNRFYNPVLQNKTHIKWLDKLLGGEIPLFSVIVFSERCELKKIQVENPDIHIIKRDRLYATVRKVWESREDCLDEERLNEIYEKLKVLTKVDEAVKIAHVNKIQGKYQKKEKDEAPAAEVPKEQATCPQCGGDLVLRTAKKGSRAGKQFYGCSNYPKCRYTIDVNDGENCKSGEV